MKNVIGSILAKGEPAKGSFISANPARMQAKNKNTNLSMLLPPFNNNIFTGERSGS